MPPSKHYLKDHVIRFSRANFDAVARCFFYSTLTLRLWKQLKIDQEYVPGTDICFPVTKGDATADLHEKRIRAFVDDVQKNKLKLADSGTIVVTKVEHKKYWLVTTTEELERWHLRYQLDVIDPDELSKQLTTMMEELNKEALADGQSGANEDNVEFDIQFAS